ncbi:MULTISPECIES: glycosyltransferase [unclassified Bradyrhizobium]|uniref:glycosyltransferase n=1 Tax=unclassified Bradyrhizobium TaxID=2631580 RepID=UPI001FFABA9A|nr:MULTISPECIES: glycosyltransferase [unclassified Bradyrhizobium]MCK1305155.1 glycosyltransferase [Bradyrhizobium sp. 45]MCK1612668.1 glycosyltransferase [Bradyrhizobium sp. 163]MCK1765538.1 glycosyltransferase [Bradyrhizobium sp. 136]
MISRKLKVLHIIASVDPAFGGPVEGILQQNRATRSIEREIVSLDPADAPFLLDFPIKTYALGSYKTGQGWRNFVKRYGVSGHLIPWLKSHVRDYDCIVVNGLWNFSTFAASRVLPNGGVPYFVFTHGMLDPWFRSSFRAKHALKQCFWLFNEGRLLANSNAALFTTQEERELARTMFWGFDYEKEVVGYGTSDPPPANQDQERQFRRLVPGLGARPFILFLSRIHPKKGCDLLIEAFARVGRQFSGTDLVIAGPDQSEMLGAFKKLATERRIADRVHFPGMLTGEAKWGAFRSADAFALPSHSENFGIVVAEALACGTPVLVSNKVNIWREIKSAKAGFVEEDTIEGTTSALSDYLSLRSAAKEQMKLNARVCFEQNFDVQKNVDAFESLVQRAVFAAGLVHGDAHSAARDRQDLT